MGASQVTILVGRPSEAVLSEKMLSSFLHAVVAQIVRLMIQRAADMEAALAPFEAYSHLSTSSPPSTASPLEPRDHAR